MNESTGGPPAAGIVILALIWAFPTVLFALRSCLPFGSAIARRLESLCAASFMASLLAQTLWLELMTP